MKKSFKFVAMFAMIAAVAVSCDDAKENNGTTDELVYLTDIPAVIAEDYTIKNEGRDVRLDGGVHVLNGATLTIEAGVKIVAQHDDWNTDYIFVEQGGKIEADGGDAAGVIVMTSTKEETGAWGGIHICGKAPINAGGESSEVGSKPYGGSNANDNSGTLRYVRLEYTGYSYSEDQECNGVSFYGVGAGTTVEYVQAYRGSDDGFEFFGGTVNIKYCVATSCSDDSFDWTDGWRGKAQFLVAYHEADQKCDCLMECDNNGDDNDATPSSHPVIANVTLVGNGNFGGKEDGVMLKAGTQVELYNALITGKKNPIVVKTAVADAALADGTSVLEGISMTSALVNKEESPKYSADKFAAVESNVVDYSANLTSNFVGTEAAAVATPSDDFFTAANFRGAVESSNDWTKGWVK